MNVESFLGVSGRRVLLDTNVIMRVEDARSADVREALLSFAKENEVCISDTVMYELLRNLNAKRFRERHALLRRAGLQCLAENAAVQAMFERLNWLYLSVLRSEPWTFLHRQQNDLWIIAAGLANGVQSFLTTDRSADFLPQFFSTETFVLDEKRNDCTICLHTFQNARAVDQWKQLEHDEECRIRLPKGYLDKIKAESWKGLSV